MRQRQSNLELLRIVAILFVLVVHVDYIALGIPTWEEWKANMLSSSARIFVEQSCLICVNLFVLVSGWFGIKATQKKLASLLFQVLFCSLSAMTIAHWFLGAEIGYKDLIKSLLIGYPYWFVASYFLLFLFSPMFNSFIETCPKKQLFHFLCLFFTLSTLFGIAPHDLAGFKNGYGALSFFGLYLLGRYMRVHSGKMFVFKPAIDFCVFLLLVLLSSFGLLVIIKWELPYSSFFTSYNAPFVVVESVFFFLLFTKIRDFQSRVVNYLAPSAFSIYLIHTHPLLFESYLQESRVLFESYSGLHYWWRISVFVFLVGITCILIDQIRRLLWNWLANWLNPLFIQKVNKTGSIS